MRNLFYSSFPKVVDAFANFDVLEAIFTLNAFISVGF